VVLLDLEMPVMDGYEAAARLRELEQGLDGIGRKRCKIVAISSNDDRPTMARALAAGCDDYLVKPARREALWRILAGVPVRELAPAEEKEADPADPVLIDDDLRASLPAFLESRRKALDEMPQALAADDRVRFKRLAHRLAGGLPLYGFLWGSAQCHRLEADALQGDAADLRARAAAVRAWLDAAAIEFRPAKKAANIDTP
jgi:CheY-like chemotaxis protein